jgi:hypothetical protein
MRLKNDGGACYNTHRNKGMLRKKKEGEHMKIGPFGMIALGALAVFAVYCIVGLIQMVRAKRRGETLESQGQTENVADLNDHFIRARYMSEDGD